MRTIQEMIDDYFIGELDKAYHLFGAHFTTENDKDGVRFTVFAPNAKNVQVVGDFNGWNGNYNWLSKIDDRGIWSIFIEGLHESQAYKYNIQASNGGWSMKADPYAFYSEYRPQTASRLFYLKDYDWQDDDWMKRRENKPLYNEPLNIYELHLGSWQRKNDTEFFSYEEMVDLLIPYIKGMDYTHVEIMPLTEHPFDGSWGYQVTGYFSATARYGDPKILMYLIDQFHQNDIGVIMDWVPVHFCKDKHGLIDFDGSPLYEYPFEDIKENRQWGTRQFDLGKIEVRQFLISSANFWLDYYHLDGLRVDAVSYIIYFLGDSSRGVNQNGLQFLKEFNSSVHKNFPGVLTIAEDSSSYPNVTEPVYNNGLGFDYKWDLGWMNDTLGFMEKDFDRRKDEHASLTFGMMYRYNEKFILPFSHDEVVHGKKSMLDKMPGNYSQKFSNLRLLLGYMYAYPSKMLTFMGAEFGQFAEWNENKSIEWELKRYPLHDSLTRFVKDLNEVYKENESLYEKDHDHEGFVWCDVNSPHLGVYSFIRRGFTDSDILVVCNFTPETYYSYKVPVLQEGYYKEILNSDKDIYGGNNIGNYHLIQTKNESYQGKDYTLSLNIPPLSILLLKIEK